MSGSNYTLTPNLGLYKPNYDMDDGQWGYHLNANADALDSAIHFASGGGPFLPLSGGSVLGTVSIGTAAGVIPPASLTASGKMWVGAATARNSSYSNEGIETWITHTNSNLYYFDRQSQFQAMSQPGDNYSIAGLFAVRSSDTNTPSSPTFGGIAGTFYAYNDAGATTPLKQNWAIYINGRRNAGSGSVLGIEFEVCNLGDVQVVNSYTASNNGVTVNLWSASGGDMTPGTQHPISAHMVMLNTGSVNPAAAEKGIVAMTGAVRMNTTAGGGTAGTVLQMARNHQIEWIFSGSGTPGSFIRSDAAGAGLGIMFQSSTFNVVDAATETPRLSVTTAGDVTATGAFTATGNITGNYVTGLNGLVIGASGAYGGIDSTGMNFVTIGASGRRAGTFALLTGDIVVTGGAGGPTWTSGGTAPSATAPVGSLYSRVGGAVGATLYVSRGGGTWAAVAGV